MKLAGEYRVKSTPKAIRDSFRKPEYLKKHLPNCIAAYKLDDENTLVSFQRIERDQEEQNQYIFRFSVGEDENHFKVSWKGTDPDSLISTGRHQITLTPVDDEIILSYRTQIVLTIKGRVFEGDSSVIVDFNNQFFDNTVKHLHSEDGKMTDHKKNLDDAVQNAEDAVMGLEHEAEEAAARGFLGGAPMWGWISIGILALVLLVFFR